jgi:hypothetical protein
MIQARYRRDYAGEFVVINTDIRRGIKEQRREWIANPIINQHISNRAAVIGSNTDLEQFDFSRLQKHRGGLQGRLRLQTYGSGSIWQHMRLDFYSSTDRPTLLKLQEQNYNTTTTCYSSSRFCMMFPERFFLIPFQPVINDLAAAIYLAAFDGHQEIFLLGYNQDTPGNTIRWQQDIVDVISAFDTHQFYFIGSASNIPGEWKNLSNVECKDYRWFVHHCDV